MLVICEDCSKKYDVDENKITGLSAKFKCRQCGHVIVVEKHVAEEPSDSSSLHLDDPSARPEDVVSKDASYSDSINEAGLSETTAAADQAETDAQKTGRASGESEKKSRGTGVPVIGYMAMTLIVGFLIVAGAFTYLYFTFIPGVINNQVELRNEAIGSALSGTIHKPLLLRNYLEVNKEAQRISKIPGVAYVAVINNRNIPIAGFFGALDKFEPQFAADVKAKGFPRDLVNGNKPAEGGGGSNVRLTVGGQAVVDHAIAIEDTGSSVRVGVFVSEVDDSIRRALMSPVTIGVAGGLILVGVVLLIVLNKILARPMRELTKVARRISVGQLDLEIDPKGPREMRELAKAFARMQVSIKSALDRLK